MVKCTAAEVLTGIVNKGDTRAVTALMTCLEDADVHVRRSSVKALALVANRGEHNSQFF